MNRINQKDTHGTIERVARESYGRLVAYLSVHTHDLASAEDALGDALVSALNHWPRDGVKPLFTLGQVVATPRRVGCD